MKIAVIGLGWLGESLAHYLTKKGHTVWGTYRQSGSQLQNSFPLVLPLTEEITLPDDFLHADVLILSLPPSGSSVPLKDAYQSFFDQFPYDSWGRILLFNSISVYGENAGLVNEKSIEQPDTARAKAACELESSLITSCQFLTSLRLGGLIGENRHPIRSLAGKEVSLSGPINLISQIDLIRALEIILQREELPRKINIVTPHHPSKQEYYSEAARRFGLPAPKWKPAEQENYRIVESLFLKEINFKFLDPALLVSPSERLSL